MKKENLIFIQDFFPRIQADINQRFPIASFFLFLMLIVKEFFDVFLPPILFFLVSLLVLSSIPIDLFFNYFKERNPKIAHNSYFLYMIFDLFLLTLIINFTGGITWIIPSIYLFYIINLFWLFTLSQSVYLVFWLSTLFLFLVIGNYFELFSRFEIFSIEERNFQNFSFVFTTTIAVLAIIGFLAYSADTFYRLLEKTIRELRRKREELSKVKKFLEREVEKRTAELAREKRKMEREVELRTRELSEKKRLTGQRLKELERFHKIAVSRELQMAEIKEKIKKIKELK